MQLKCHIINLQSENVCAKVTQPQISESELRKYINSLKTGRAADVFDMTVEHIKYASPQLTAILTSLVNNIFKDKKMPPQFKIGSIAPILKKNKPKKDTDSHRRITIAPAVGKIVEKEMMTRTKPQSKLEQDPRQYGFTKGRSPPICALMVSEAIAECKDLDQPLYVTFMDSSKAFDMVDHSILLNAQHDLELDPHMWKLYHDMYETVNSRGRVMESSQERYVKVEGYVKEVRT